MPFDGSGTYTPAAPPNFPAIGNTVISANYYNSVINDIASALSNTITRDGQGRPAANINWNNKDLTGIDDLAAATATFTEATIGALTATSLDLASPLSIAEGGTGAITAALALAALGGQGLFTLTTAGSGVCISIPIGSSVYKLQFGIGGALGAGTATYLTLPVPYDTDPPCIILTAKTGAGTYSPSIFNTGTIVNGAGKVAQIPVCAGSAASLTGFFWLTLGI